MNLVAHGPFRVTSLLWQPRPGAWSLAIACRAGFELAPGESPLVTLPKEAPDEERRLLEQAVLLVPRKRWPEVVVVGDAYAPEGKPVTSLAARIAVGSVDKVIEVAGDRHFSPGGELVGPAPFTRMSLRWDRAAGGPDTWNPVGVGMGAGARPDGWGRVALPNLGPAGASIMTRRDLLPPVGFGPIPPRWPTRLERLRRHAPSWDLATGNERPLPEDFDFAYFDVAPPDQALADLTGDERIVLEHLHPRHARLATCLRVVPPRATAGVDGISREVPLRCDTLIIDSDLGIAQLVWRGQVPLDHPQRAGIVIVESAPAATAATPSKTVVLADPVPGAPRPPDPPVAPAGVSLLETRAAPVLPPQAALPFQPGAAAVPPAPPLPITMGAPTTGEASGSLPPAIAPSPRRSPMVETIAPFPVPPRASLPFGERAPVRAAPVPFAPRFGAPPLPPPEAPPPEAVSAAPRFGAPPPPPPLIGPLATPEMVAAETSTSAETPDVEARSADAPRPPTDFTIERCAAIAASIARRREATAETLQANDLDAERWAALERRWSEAVAAEVRRSRTGLLRAYDAAYVARLEEERGPIGLAEYARLLVAAERGNQGDLLDEMSLPRGAVLRIERVWLRRIAADGALAGRVAEAMKAAREL